MLPLNFRVVHGVLLGGGEDFFIQMAAPEQDIGAAAPRTMQPAPSNGSKALWCANAARDCLSYDKVSVLLQA